MNQTISKVVTGAIGVSSTEIVEQVVSVDPSVITETGGLIIQVIIAIATIWKLFFGKKSKEV